MKIIVKQDQTIYDVALQYAGSLEAVVSILVANGKANTALLIGEELEIPDVLVARVAGFFNDKGWVPATSPKPLDPDGWVPPPGLDRKVQILIDNVFLGEVLAPSSLNIAVIDQDDNPITPISSVLAGGVATVKINAGSATGSGTNSLHVTGQTISYADGDDGDTQRGRSFWMLEEDNWFGHKQRFVGVDGGYHDKVTDEYKLVDGTVTTRILAFPNEIMLDMDTVDKNDNCNGYWIGTPYANNWADLCLFFKNTFSIGVFSSGWGLINMREAFSLWHVYNEGNSPSRFWQWKPLFEVFLDRSFFTSNKSSQGAVNAISNNSYYQCGFADADANSTIDGFPSRIFNKSEII